MTAIKSVSNPHNRKPVHLNCSEPLLTDQSYKKATDINNIMAQYAKTGMLPNFQNKQPVYIDETTIPDALTSFNVVNRARELFQELPAIVRKAMDNDPAQMEKYIQDPENHHFLLKHGVLTKKQDAKENSSLTSQHNQIVKEVTKETAQG